MTTTLYNLSHEWAAIEQLLIDNDGDLTPETEAQLDSLAVELQEKVDGYCALIESFEGAAEHARQVSERAKRLEAARQNAADRLRGRLKEALQTLGRDKVSTPNFVARIQINSRPSIRWMLSEELIPVQYRKVAVTPDGKKAYDDWRQFGVLPEGFDVSLGTHLRIQ